MTTVTVVAKVVARPDSVEALRGELLKLIAPTRLEDGCLEYRLHHDDTDPAVFLFYENWQNRSCLERHMNTPHFKAYVAATSDLISDKSVLIMSEIS